MEDPKTSNSEKEKSLPEELEQVLLEKLEDKEHAGDYLARLTLFIDTLTPNYRKPFIGDEWSPANDASRFQNLVLNPPNLDMGQLLQQGYVTQEVTIAPGVKITFRSRTPDDESFLSMWSHLEGEKYEKRESLKKEQAVTEEYQDAIFDVTDSSRNLRELAMFVHGINQKPLSTGELYVTKDGRKRVSLEVAKRRRDALRSMPSVLVEDLFLHLYAFDQRVSELYGIPSIRAF